MLLNKARSLALMATALVLFMGNSLAWAHHSFAAAYNMDNPIEITGKIVNVRLTNPHSYFFLDVEGENGEQTVAARSSKTFATVSQTFVAFTRLCHLRYVPLRAVFDMWDFCLCMFLSCCLMFLILIDPSLAAPPDSRFRNRHCKRAPM